MEPLDKLLMIIDAIAEGYYSNDIMPLTEEGQPEIIRRIAEAMGLMMVRVEAREYNLEMLIEELENLNETIRQNTIKVVSSLANALASRDTYTEGHTARVSEYATKMAQYMDMDEKDIEFVRLGSILHDIGKIGFPDALFQAHEGRNPSNLDNDVLEHPTTGAKILEELDFLGRAVEYVHCHHEQPDGNGYPRGLTDEQIPLGAKIIAVADSYDAMTTDRTYQKGRTKEEAFEILIKLSRTQWDLKCVEALITVLDG
ncbi:MAG: HD domain-containing protein [Gammaproteobacteria bacterium]|nr:HD domain-containing protein [Gammaproteobacteria bacterium]